MNYKRNFTLVFLTGFLLVPGLFSMKRSSPIKFSSFRDNSSRDNSSYPCQDSLLSPAELPRCSSNLSLCEDIKHSRELYEAIAKNKVKTVKKHLRRENIAQVALDVFENIICENHQSNIVLSATNNQNHALWELVFFCKAIEKLGNRWYLRQLRIKTKGFTLLHTLAQKGYFDPLKFYLDQNISPNIQSDDGNTLLHLAAKMGHFNVVRLLLEKGVDVQMRNDQNQTPLDLVIKQKNIALRSQIFFKHQAYEAIRHLLETAQSAQNSPRVDRFVLPAITSSPGKLRRQVTNCRYNMLAKLPKI